MSPSAATDAARTVDRSLSLLASGPRRAILTELSSSPGIGGEELDRIRARFGATEVEFETQLFHVHLPKLTAEEVVEFDLDPLSVRRGPRFEELGPLLEALRPIDGPVGD
ncbi:hypothetical protein I7X12_18890 [Halosimplex litoreum]|uniref:ArsR family transcriptional regulator n=1 Tax=Halosimplex litoreum TaxID=1198301 RepID=A0A7T3FXU0_9EURY|nr:hypothetical protein [Halosimplex litoreum]QPV62764.1 hypothetical protein I7X12_18890 [Halosimplex litoreum]